MCQKNPRPRGTPVVALLCAAALTVLAACGSSPQAIVDSDTTTATPSATATVADAEVDIDAGSTWQEAFDTLTAAEQSCIRDELDEDTFELGMKQTAISEDAREQWVTAIFSCSEFDTPRRQLLAEIMADIREGIGGEVEVSDDEAECLREWVIGLDDDDMTVMLTQEDDALGASFSLEALACLPDLLLNVVAASTGTDAIQLSDDERECVREWAADLDPAFLTAEDNVTLGMAGFGMFACVPNLFVELVPNMIGVNNSELSDEERECLREWVDGLDEDDMMVILAQENGAAALELGLGILACLPELVTSSFGDAANIDVNAVENAAPAAVGEAVDGAIDDLLEVDYFKFQAKAGVSYQIDVTPLTMSDPTLELFDSNLESLDYSDDYMDLAPRIQWEAPSSGTYYVAVEGYDLGTYSLTIAAQ